MKQSITSFFKNFLKCGLAGWCMEIIFTSLKALRSKDFTLTGHTSLWMFPIYGGAALFSPISRLIRTKSILVRGLTYMSLIFSAEYLSGKFLLKRNLCPWDYGNCRFHINRVIRLDFAPYWFGAGLLFERLVASSSSKRDTPATKTHPH